MPTGEVVPFSILGRIVGAVTAEVGTVLTALGDFQYPRTDRWGCDYAPTRRRGSRAVLSVSSDGSLGL